MSVSVLSPQTVQTLHMPVDLERTNGPEWPDIVSSLKPGLHRRGFDISEPLCLDWYNESLPEGSGASIPTTRGSRGGETLVILIANSNNMWPSFLQACKTDSSLLAVANPLDSYVERSIQSTMHTSLPGHKCRYFWSHSQSDELSGSRYVAIQRMAQAAGLAYMDPITHLCLHPKFGPWIALRCALVFDGTQYTGPRKTPLVNRLSPSTEQYVQMAMKSAQRKPSMSLEDAGTKSKPCKRWLKWVAVRDALCPCHPWRYGEDQLEYHYTKNRAVLERAISRQ